MATLEYINIPDGATQLRGVTNNTGQVSNNIRPATKIMTGLPPSPSLFKERGSLLSSSLSTSSVLSSPALSLLPHLLLSSSLPPSSSNPAIVSSSSNATPSPQNCRKNEHSSKSLLSSRDPISIPMMTSNFKRFVAVIGPVFWLQDRIEEIMLWKCGWLRTTAWMAFYAFFCFYPRLLLLLPQVAIIGIILATYPYPPASSSSSDPLFYTADDSLSPSGPPAEGSIPWQANIQGIQNLMGATADLFALAEPYTYHLRLHPSHLSRASSSSSSSSTAHSATRPPSPYTPHILTLLAVSFPFLAFIISLPSFPVRDVCLISGLLPFFLTHPWTRTVGVIVVQTLVIQGLPIARKRIQELTWKLQSFHMLKSSKQKENKSDDNSCIGQGVSDVNLLIWIKTFLQRVIDDDRLSDSCWNSEMREVELWENERLEGSVSIPLTTSIAPSASSSSLPATVQKGWSKRNLKKEERSAWTRGRDGWSPVVGSKAENASPVSGIVEGHGEISSNLTFSLAPGWAFVETEDWRKDLKCEWSGCGSDMDGWVYTNDAWLGSRPTPYTSGGSVTRRRRWVRRVWFDEERYKRDS